MNKAIILVILVVLLAFCAAQSVEAGQRRHRHRHAGHRHGGFRRQRNGPRRERRERKEKKAVEAPVETTESDIEITDEEADFINLKKVWGVAKNIGKSYLSSKYGINLDEAEEDEEESDAEFLGKIGAWWKSKGESLFQKGLQIYSAIKAAKKQPTPAPETPAPAPAVEAPVAEAEAPAQEEEVESDSESSQSINGAGLNLIKQAEGWRACVYKDAVGLPTIGYGHLIKAGEKFNCISQSEGENLLRRDVASFESCVSRNVKVPINSNQFSALVSFSFNLGCGNLQSSTLLKKINAKAPISEICGEFKKWTKAGGKVLPGLVTRRDNECNLYRS